MAVHNTVARSLHDAGLAGWFGGSLMGAIGLNGASDEVADPRERAAVANAGWARWTPVNAAAIVAHLLGGAQIVRGNKGRLLVQPQARRVGVAKAALTLTALGATAYSRWLGQQLMDAGDAQTGVVDRTDEVPVDDAVTPLPSTPDRAAGAQRQLNALQWVVPASTGVLLVLNAKAGEQQRPMSILRDRMRAGVPLAGRAAPSALTNLPWKAVAGGVVSAFALRRLARRRGRRTLTGGHATARDIMTGDVTVVAPHDSLRVAAQRMIDRNVGALPVTSNGRLEGIVTDRDIVARAVAEGADLSNTTVREVASTSVQSVAADDPVRDVVRTMASERVRRVPVTDNGTLVGMISQADVAATGDDAVTGELVEIISTTT